MTRLIRHRLIYLLLLGAVTTALSLTALVRALSLTEAQRLDRARDGALTEVDRLAHEQETSDTLEARPITTYVGMHGGWLDDATAIARVHGLPDAWRGPLERALERSRSVPRDDPSARVVSSSVLGSSDLVVAVEPAQQGGYAWTAILIVPSTFLRPWKWLAIGIAIATALLVATTLASVLSFRRQTQTLQSTLVALGKDLHTPVPSLDMAELAQVADGIKRMASDLLSSRADKERLSEALAVKERLAALGRVAAGVAHEVRNPLAAIKLRLDLTATSQELPETTRRAVASASQEIARLDRLVSDLLVVAGKQLAVRQEVDLAALVRGRIDTLQPWAEQHEVTFVTEGHASVEADAGALARAIDNLLRNGVEASPRGERVIARIKPTLTGAELAFEDHGGGVDPDRGAQLFEPFFTTKPEGTGLGLALSRAIARAHGGELTYTRDRSATTFVLVLPRGADAVAA